MKQARFHVEQGLVIQNLAICDYGLQLNTMKKHGGFL